MSRGGVARQGISDSDCSKNAPGLSAEKGDMMKKILLTGAAGALGSRLRAPMAAMADELLSTDLPEVVGDLQANETYRQADLANFDLVREMAEGAERAKKTLHAYLDEAMAEEGMTPDRTIIIGFSQGTMMALDVTMRRDEAFAGLVGFSGRLIESDAPMTCRTPVLLVHGDQDPMVPVSSLPEAADALSKAGYEVFTHISKGTQHGIAPDGLGVGLQFMKQVFKL